ncbi:MAG: protein translocase subunit SecF [Candidatus Yanofskybacteria bacterium CG10_big_fil_rev_8_21_14_0_10_37_15]|uniref:Protein-export membrane protein SecF n=1 Tax=Candidatus Yanofskybacteria bacterium CG10_big_fil_rev_8_21_14_0_10_37_15 TaxID=1975097 RepID=A0A2H0R5P3_9BACT|nr:MAG: protein translocase subunit SecF [Candidatus Yanofskybacteria bacterium CG10_big_fil_rev_8_21_14_0_10_37_15]
MLPKIYNYMFWFSIILALASIISISIYGLNLGVDFKGGTVLDIEFTQERPEISAIQNVSFLKETVINSSGDSGIIIRTGQITEQEHQDILLGLQSTFPESGIQENKFDSVGPIIGNELKSKSLKAIVLVLLAITLYMTIVFRRISDIVPSWVMGVAALIALLHDLIIPTGVFAWLGYYYGVEISAVFVAAVLTVLGYSVSDSVVVFDRIRENIIRDGNRSNFGAVVHESIMQTLTRSLNTTFTTLLALVAIYFFGGESIKYFALALIMGIFFGAYSSIFVASPVLVWVYNRKRRNV